MKGLKGSNSKRPVEWFLLPNGINSAYAGCLEMEQLSKMFPVFRTSFVFIKCSEDVMGFYKAP